MNVTVVSATKPPVAHNDTATTKPDKSVTVNVVSNDTDPQKFPLTISKIVSGPAHGIATIVGNEIKYTPNYGFHDTDVLTYRINDGHGNSATAKLSITVSSGVGIGKDPTNPALNALDIVGTSHADTISVKSAGSGKVTVFFGYDSLSISSAVKNPEYIDGGAGNNTIHAGGGNAILLGNQGDDQIFGGAGRDILIGEDGNDGLHGGSGDAILIAGNTAYESNLTDLFMLEREWSRTDGTNGTYKSRVHALTSGTHTNNFAGGLPLDAATVSSSPHNPDTLFGGSGEDLFYYNPEKIHGVGDKISGARSGETIVSTD
jgi:Ca2+-binding RTX toxin-like protein